MGTRDIIAALVVTIIGGLAVCFAWFFIERKLKERLSVKHEKSKETPPPEPPAFGFQDDYTLTQFQIKSAIAQAESSRLLALHKIFFRVYLAVWILWIACTVLNSCGVEINLFFEVFGIQIFPVALFGSMLFVSYLSLKMWLNLKEYP